MGLIKTSYYLFPPENKLIDRFAERCLVLKCLVVSIFFEMHCA